MDEKKLADAEDAGRTRAKNRWLRAHVCERCGSDTMFATEQPVTLAGGLTVRLCLDCRRDWDVNAHVQDLFEQMNVHAIRCSSFEYAGNADKAEEEFRASMCQKEKLRDYAVAWFKDKITRDEVADEEG